MARRKIKTHAAYPRSSRFLWHGAGKDYYRVWEDFKSGKSNTPPPDFKTFVEEWRANGYKVNKTKRSFLPRRRKRRRRS